MYIPYRDLLVTRDPLRLVRNRLLQSMTPPGSEPVTLTEAKLYLRVDNTNDDTLIADLITAARVFAEGWLRRSLISQAWKIAFDCGIPDSVWLPMGPVTSVSSVTVFNKDNSSQAADSSTYWLNAAQNALMLNSVLIGFRVEIIYAAGYGSSESDVPRPIKQGMLSHIAAMYDSRGEDGDAALPEQAAALYMPFREVRL